MLWMVHLYIVIICQKKKKNENQKNSLSSLTLISLILNSIHNNKITT